MTNFSLPGFLDTSYHRGDAGAENDMCLPRQAPLIGENDVMMTHPGRWWHFCTFDCRPALTA